MGHSIGCKGRAFWDCTGLPTGCLGEEAEAGKGMDLDALGPSLGKQQDKEIKRGWLLAGWSVLLIMCSAVCPVVLLNSFPVCGSLLHMHVCACACLGLQVEWDQGLEAHVSMMGQHWEHKQVCECVCTLVTGRGCGCCLCV